MSPGVEFVVKAFLNLVCYFAMSMYSNLNVELPDMEENEEDMFEFEEVSVTVLLDMVYQVPHSTF